jgi:hypothetical protein
VKKLCYDAEDPTDEGRREFLTRNQAFAFFSPHFPREEKQSKHALVIEKRNTANMLSSKYATMGKKQI